MTTIELTRQYPQEFVPNYLMGAEDMRELFIEESRALDAFSVTDKTNIFIVDNSSTLANYVRSVEASALPTVPEFMQAYEENSRFMIVAQDKEGGVEHDRPAHVFRVNFNDDKHRIVPTPDTPTGIPTFDDVLKLGLVTEEQLLDFYVADSLATIGTCYINVESNVAIDGVARSIRKPYSALGYKAIFDLVSLTGVRGIVAYQNEEAISSLSHLGLKTTPLVGDPNIHTDNPDKTMLGEENSLYYPLTVEGVPWSRLMDGTPEHNTKMFSDPVYAKTYSRLAGAIATRPINVIYIS